MNKVFCLLAALAILVSCSNSPDPATEIKTIDLTSGLKNTRDIKLSEVGADIDFLKLELTEGSLIGAVRKVYKVDDQYVILNRVARGEHGMDPHNILVFDKNGKFEHEIGTKGKGPGEYEFLLSSCVDTKNSFIFILSSTKKLLQFSISGGLIRETTLPFRATSVSVFNEQLLFHFNYFTYMENDHHLYLLSDYELQNQRRFVPAEEGKRAFYRAKTYKFGKNRFQWVNMRGDSIFQLSKDFEFTPVAHIDFPAKVPQEAFYDISKLHNTYTFVNTFYELADFYFFVLTYDRMLTSLVYNKLTDESSALKVYQGFKNDLSGGMRFFPKGFFDGHTVYSYANLAELKPYWEKNYDPAHPDVYDDLDLKVPGKAEALNKLIMESTDEDNPVLVFVKLK